MEKLLMMLDLTGIKPDKLPSGIKAIHHFDNGDECSYPDGSYCKCDCGFCPCSQCFCDCDDGDAKN